MKIKKKGYKYSPYKDYQKMAALDNFGNKCTKCGKAVFGKEKEVCDECNKK